MSTCSNITLNNLAPTQYTVTLKRAPNLIYKAQTISLPNVDLPSAIIPTPTVAIPMPGDHIEFGIFSMAFLIDENLLNYREIFNWMKALAPPQSLANYTLKNRAIGNNRPNPTSNSTTLEDTWTSDISVSTLTSGSNPNIQFTLRDCYPTSLSNFDMNTQDTSVEYVTASVTFAIRDFTIE